jgi:hypothetical protein
MAKDDVHEQENSTVDRQREEHQADFRIPGRQCHDAGFGAALKQPAMQGNRRSEDSGGNDGQQERGGIDATLKRAECGKRLVKATPIRKAKRICTPVWATRSSWSSSTRLRSARCSGVSYRGGCGIGLGSVGMTLTVRATIATRE